MEELQNLLNETELKLISFIKDRKIKESKETIKLWEHIIEVATELV